MPDNIVLIMRFHPVGGEDVSVVSEDFGGEREALEAIAQALDERRSLVLTHARYDREADQSGVIINLANVVSVRVSKTDSAACGCRRQTVRRRASTCDSWSSEGENAATLILPLIQIQPPVHDHRSVIIGALCGQVPAMACGVSRRCQQTMRLAPWSPPGR